MNFQEQMSMDKALVENALAKAFEGKTPHGDIYDAMNYSLLSGGKRLRPILVLETCRMCGGDPEKAMPLAVAVEMIHCYSLIHDDLPCMDNDDLRRGKLTNHKVFGETTALLAGDGLLAAAFEEALLARQDLPVELVAECTAVLARAAGAAGMVGGQVMDMAGEGRSLTLSDVVELQELKTGALISAACEMGCLAAGGSEDDRRAVRLYAQKLGLAFQIRDDMLDVISTPQVLGKSVGKDAKAEKTTFVDLKGLEECGRLVRRLTDEAKEAISGFEGSDFLSELANTLVERTY